MKVFFVLLGVFLILTGCNHQSEENKNIYDESGKDGIPEINDNGIWKEADSGMWKSIDGGDTWKEVSNFQPSDGDIASLPDVEVERIIFNPKDSSNIYLAGEAFGIFYSNDAGERWYQFDIVRRSKIRSLAVSPKHTCTVFAVTDNLIYKTKDCGQSWHRVYKYPDQQVTFTDIIVDLNNPYIVYATNGIGELLKSEDSGNNWEITPCKSYELNPFVGMKMDPLNTDIIYIATRQKGLFKTVNGGESCEFIGNGADSIKYQYRKFLIDSTNPNNFYIISAYGISKTTDGGASWEPFVTASQATSTQIYAAAINPQDGNQIAYSDFYYFYKTNDGGKTWSKQKWPFAEQEHNQVHNMMFDPQNSNNMYIGILDIDVCEFCYLSTNPDETSNIFGLHMEVWGDFSDISGDVSDLRGDITDLSGDVTNILGDMSKSGVYGNVSGLYGDITDIRGRATGVYGHVDELVP